MKQPGLFDPEPPSLLDDRLAILDLETSGTSAARDRIIEIGLVQMSGGVIEDQWSTLVNPEIDLTEFIEDYTGISSQMVATAPVFATLADELRARLDNRVLVAHNAPFDYSFLRQEFFRAGFTFHAPTLCTVRLSRKLYPKEPKHNLDALMARHKLRCDGRHRALGDARVLVDFLQVLRDQHTPVSLNQAITAQLKPPTRPG